MNIHGTSNHRHATLKTDSRSELLPNIYMGSHALVLSVSGKTVLPNHIYLSPYVLHRTWRNAVCVHRFIYINNLLRIVLFYSPTIIDRVLIHPSINGSWLAAASSTKYIKFKFGCWEQISKLILCLLGERESERENGATFSFFLCSFLADYHLCLCSFGGHQWRSS